MCINYIIYEILGISMSLIYLSTLSIIDLLTGLIFMLLPMILELMKSV